MFYICPLKTHENGPYTSVTWLFMNAYIFIKLLFKFQLECSPGRYHGNNNVLIWTAVITLDPPPPQSDRRKCSDFPWRHVKNQCEGLPFSFHDIPKANISSYWKVNSSTLQVKELIMILVLTCCHQVNWLHV